MNAIAEKLIAARKLIERGWCQEEWARDAEGNGVLEHEPEAVCWCAGGAMFRVGGKRIKPGELYDAFEKAIGESTVAKWNDTPGRTQSEVLAAFDRAIEIAESGQ